MYDKDGSGTIEMSEMVEVLETVYVMEGVISEDNTSMAKNRAKQIFSELDMDGNGSLTCDEFIEGKYWEHIQFLEHLKTFGGMKNPWEYMGPNREPLKT